MLNNRPEAGFKIKPTIHVRDLSPINESRKTCVNLLARNGKYAPARRPSARIHSCNRKGYLTMTFQRASHIYILFFSLTLTLKFVCALITVNITFLHTKKP